MIGTSIAFSLMLMTSCQAQTYHHKAEFVEYSQMKPGAEQTELYFPAISGKSVGIVANPTSRIGDIHLVDSLIGAGVKVSKIFCPEHGFRGGYEAGANIDDQIDTKTNIQVISLYGNHKKPTKEDLNDIEIMIFDIQDIGVRFYTYISTLTLVMEACAEDSIPLVVLDRPNPNGFYVDGPALDKNFTSFVGMHPVPVVYGMTIGEYAMMVNQEGWLKDRLKCDLQVIPIKDYHRRFIFELPVRPSPNLPNWRSIYLYPSLALFEGTIISVGRGTDLPFQVIGHPDYLLGSYAFTPRSIPGVSENPPYKDQHCYGGSFSGIEKDYVNNTQNYFTLFYLIEKYQFFRERPDFFNSYFDKLAGTSQLREDIIAGKSEEDIRKTWKASLDNFLSIRQKYLIYPD